MLHMLFLKKVENVTDGLTGGSKVGRKGDERTK